MSRPIQSNIFVYDLQPGDWIAHLEQGHPHMIYKVDAGRYLVTIYTVCPDDDQLLMYTYHRKDKITTVVGPTNPTVL